MLAKHRRGPWTSHEDQYLLDLVRTQGASNWVRISQLIGTRSPKQCRERFHQNLKPSLNLDPITPEEGVLIERMVAEMGKRWAEIARRLHNRSDNAVKNWWNGGMNRRKRLENRRAEYAPRQPPQQVQMAQMSQMQMPMPQMSQMIQQMPQMHHHQQQQQQQQQPHHLQHFEQQPQPAPHVSSYDFYPTRQPIQPTHLAPSAMPYGQPQYVNHARRLMDGPNPSPSGFSSYSRAESAEGAPPSLVSEMSYGSYSHPSTPRQSSDLAPLGGSSYSLPHHHRQTSSNSSYNVGTSYPAPKMEMAPQAYPLLAEQWPPRQSTSPGQLPLPNFNTVTGDYRQGSPNSPPKDTRMKLSNLMS